MLWEVEIRPAHSEQDLEGQRVLDDAKRLGISGLKSVRSARAFLIQGDISEKQMNSSAAGLLCDTVVEDMTITALPDRSPGNGVMLINVMLQSSFIQWSSHSLWNTVTIVESATFTW